MAALSSIILALSFQTAPILPYGWLEACGTQQATNCETPAPITILDVTLVHVAISNVIRPKKDAAGEIERWEAFPIDRRGDCSAQVMSKRAALIALGMDPTKLVIVVGEVYRDGKWRMHMVLTVTVGAETVVLDNLSPTKIYSPGKGPFPWRETARQPSVGLMWSKR